MAQETVLAMLIHYLITKNVMDADDWDRTVRLIANDVRQRRATDSPEEPAVMFDIAEAMLGFRSKQPHGVPPT